jgi:hypothetical protein
LQVCGPRIYEPKNVQPPMKMLTVSILLILSLFTLETTETLFKNVQKCVEFSHSRTAVTRSSDNTTCFTAYNGLPMNLGLRTRVRGGGSPLVNSGQAPRKSFVVNLLTPAERLLRKQLEEEALLQRTKAAAVVPDSNRTRMYKEGVRKLARYDYAPLNQWWNGIAQFATHFKLILSLLVSEFLAEMGPSADGITVDSIMRHWADEFGPDLPEKQLIDAAADGDAAEVLILTEIVRIPLQSFVLCSLECVSRQIVF